MVTKLPQKVHSAISLIKGSDCKKNTKNAESGESNFKQRAKKLESIGESGFAIILYWNQIEAALKLIRYYDRIKDGWPNELVFIRATWKPLQELKGSDPAKYELVLSGSNQSLWKIRNGIVHEGCNITVVEYSKYVEAALWMILELNQKIPNLERLRDRKRRSDAQLKKT